MDVKKEISDYLHYCKHQKKLSDLSIKAYEIDLRQFLAYTISLPEHEISKAVISGYIQELLQKYTPLSAKRKIASIRAFLNYLEFEELLDANPMKKIKTKFQEPKRLPRTIPLNFIEQILVAAHKEQEMATTQYGVFVALRDKAMLETLFATGMRVSELCSLKTGDIDLDEGTIRIMGKGAKERIIQIGNIEVINALRQYQNSNKSNSDFFL